MANTYEPIATTTANGVIQSVTFSSIPATYTDLILIVAGNAVNNGTVITFNNDTSTNYSRTVLRGDGTSATSFRQSSQNYIAADASVSQPAQNIIMHIFNYANTTTYKTALVRSNNSSAGLDQGVGLWRATPAAINRIDVTLQGATPITSGAVFTLYGIKAA
jgi:hypothetical protein